MAHRKKPKQAQFLKALSDVPVVHVACKRAGISRATYYRWLEDDPEFKAEVDKTKTLGVDVMNDAAESVIIRGIQDGNQQAAKYWLGHNHDNYKTPARKVFEVKNFIHPDKIPPVALVEWVSPVTICEKCKKQCEGHEQPEEP